MCPSFVEPSCLRCEQLVSEPLLYNHVPQFCGTQLSEVRTAGFRTLVIQPCAPILWDPAVWGANSWFQNPCYTAMRPSFVGPSCLRCEQLVSEPRGCWIIHPTLFIFTFTYVYKSNECPLRWFQQFRSIRKRERKRNFSHTRKKEVTWNLWVGLQKLRKDG